MKFVHIADMHFDTPFTSLNEKKGLGDIRRLEQRQVFKKIIEYIKENNIPYLLIAGDLYDHLYIRESTISYINDLFNTIPNTKIFITPGNHDPYLLNSYYHQYQWADNVHIFKDKVEKIEEEEVIFYGVGFSDFYCDKSDIENINIQSKEKLNILITHADLDGSRQETIAYNPISMKQLQEKGFDYVALGHIHKPFYEGKGQTIVYPGSPISFGFDELGQHGMVLGQIDQKGCELSFVPLDTRQFVIKQVDISNCNSFEAIAEMLNQLQLEQNKLYKIVLTGVKPVQIDIHLLQRLVMQEQIIKIKDETKSNRDLMKIRTEESLRGFFVNEMIERMEQQPDKKEEIEQAIEIGLDALEG